MIKIIPESIQLIRLSDKEYFSDEYKDYVSNSKLKLINPDEGGSEELFESGLKFAYNESFDLGSAVHQTLLQPDEFFISDIRKPSGKLGLFAEHVKQYVSENIPLEKAYLKASTSADYYNGKLSENILNKAINQCSDFWECIETRTDKIPIYLSEKMYEKYAQCISELYLNGKLMNELRDAYNEYAILCEISVDGVIIKIKAKLDSFTIRENIVTLNDLKTTSHPVNYFMGNNANLIDENGNKYKKWIDGSFQKYHYYRQMAMYLYLLQAYLYKEYNQVFEYKANMLVVETVPNFRSKIFSVSEKNMQKGLDELKKCLLLVAEWKKKK
jgi:hypothetical protein